MRVTSARSVADFPFAASRNGSNSDILDGAGETLVLLGVVVLQANLEVDGLQKPLFRIGSIGVLQDFLHALVQRLFGDLRTGIAENNVDCNFCTFYWSFLIILPHFRVIF